MRRFFCNSKDISGDTINVTDLSLINHLRKVLRVKLNEKLVIFDDMANEYECAVERMLPQSIILKINTRITRAAETGARFTIACAIPKKSKFDDIIDKLTQLGAERIIPLQTERAIVKLDSHKEALRLGRWRKIALNASQQSQRKVLPLVEEVMTFEEALSGSSAFDLKLIPTLEGERKSIKDVLSGQRHNNILVLIGPEGDFSPKETALALKTGCVPVSLGELVLRVETAAVAVASYIRFSSL
ncbi:MAG: RsmE family RNA methyltransferase [Candidatus Omnitrophica bacterium]|nr:RsmE family RNA methyltransferase [Candidatus Omnitrophota bacterium]